MKTLAPGVKQYASHNDYLAKKTLQKGVLPSAVDNLKDNIEPLKKEDLIPKGDKADISPKAKDLTSKGKEAVRKDLKEVKGAGKRLLGDAIDVAKKVFTSPGTDILSAVAKIPIGNSGEQRRATIEKLIEAGDNPIVDKPGVFFLSGLNLISINGSDGVKKMAEHIPSAEHHSWKNEEQVMQEILKRPEHQPVILVGHSLGGDAAVSIANKLNTLENGFRKVSLLVTLDSVGFDNDIIPANVKRNYNVISDEDVFYNDGPNIARNKSLTEIFNELSSETHTDIDDNSDIQFKIFDSINKTLMEAVALKESKASKETIS